MALLFILFAATGTATAVPLSAPPKTPAATTEPGLEAPQKIGHPPHKATAASAPVPVPEVAPPHWLIGIVAGGEFAPSGPLRLGGSVRLQFGYVRPRNVDHLGVSFEPEVGFASNGEPAQQKSNGLLVSLPLLASANVFAGPGLLRVLVGPTLDYYSVSLANGAVHDFTDKGWSFGVEGGASYLFDLHAGLLGIDARFHYLPAYVSGARDNFYLITVGASYAFVL